MMIKPNKRKQKILMSGTLFDDISQFITQAKQHVAISINSSLVLLNWHIGRRIDKEILLQKRADYGQKIIKLLADQLSIKFGRGYSERSLQKMIQFARIFPNKQITSTLSAQLSWSHFQEIITLEDSLQRDFYAELSRIEKWGVRTLRAKIDGKLYERTILAKEPKKIIEKEIAKLRKTDQVSTQMVFRDPYVLDFLELSAEYSEKDFESAILDEILKFIKELGADFAFVDRQKRVTVADEDYYLDLLFFHRRLRRLIAIDLKLEKFKPSHKGQMELYLRWLDKYEKCPGEKSPLGIILCTDRKQDLIELLEVNNSGIHVAKYVTELKSLQQLEGKLHVAVELAQEKITKEKNVDDF